MAVVIDAVELEPAREEAREEAAPRAEHPPPPRPEDEVARVVERQALLALRLRAS